MIVVGLHNARDDRMERFECSWRVPTIPRAPNQHTSDSSVYTVGWYVHSVLHQRAGVFVKHQPRGLTEQLLLHNLPERAETHSD